jgi:CHAD domain-containing protein
MSDVLLREHLPTRIAAFIDDALREALDALSDTVADQDVHDARKSLKKARGGLRLFRPGMTDETFRAHNLLLRDAGRLLSPLRDTHSQLQLFHSLEDDTWLPSARIESALYADHSQARHTFDTTSARVRCKEMIGQVRDALGAAAFGDIDTNIEGLRDIYRKGMHAFERARKKDSAARRHELRKQAKYLRVALEVIDVPDYELARDRARRVASWLGEDHDLAVLRDRIAHSGNKSESGDERWFRRIKDRQEKLQRKAFAKAEELFEEKPKEFVAKLRAGDGN